MKLFLAHAFAMAPIAMCLAALVIAPIESRAATKVGMLEGITEYRLDNGLQVLLYPDPSKPTVTVNLTIMVGSRHEGYGETGMAHLLEHMVFKGTPTNPHIPKALQERGANFNGTTWVDRTNYYETLPASDDNLEFALKLEADRMVNSFIRNEDLISEMTVVRNEFERGENSPSNLLSQRMMGVAFDWHNYGKSTIGNRSDIERVPIRNLQAFYKKHYQPDNAMLVVAGKFDEAKAMKMIEATFGAIPKPKRSLDKTYTEEPPQDGERTVNLRRVGDLGLVGAIYHVPSGSHDDSAALDVLASILESDPSGRLYKALVATGKATKVSCGATSWHDAGVFEVEVEVRRQDSLEAARDIMLQVCENVGKDGVTKEEVERAKQTLLKQRELSAANTSSIAVELSNWASQGDWRLYLLYRDRIEKVTTADVDRVASAYLKPNNRTVGMFIPTDKTERITIPESPDLAKLFEGYKGREELAVGEAFDVDPIAIEKRVTRTNVADGVKAALLPKKTRGEKVILRLTLRYGAVDSLKGYETAGVFLPQVMARGTKQLTRQQIKDELDKNRATLATSGDTGSATFAIETKRANLPAVLALLKQIIREPSFPAEEFDVLKRQRLANHEEQMTDPQSLALVAVRRAVSPYPQTDVRYVPTVAEGLERTKETTLETVKTLYQKFLGPQAGEIAVVGDFDSEETLSALRSIFTGWSSSQPYARIPKVVFPNIPGSKQEINTPDKANAVYVAGEVFSMKDSDPVYPAMVMGNFVLGGGTLSSRLGDRVRQKEGLSYGVGSFISSDALDPRSSLTLFAICNPANIDKVVTAIREELDLILKDGITAEELERAKSGYLQEQQVSRSSDSSLASTLADSLYVGRTMEYYAKQEKEIAALNTADVLAALKKNLDAKRLNVVVAGDFKPAPASK